MDYKPLAASLTPLIELNYLNNSSIDGKAEAGAGFQSGEFKKAEPVLLKASLPWTVAFRACIIV